jgi:hypothetical protein
MQRACVRVRGLHVAHTHASAAAAADLAAGGCKAQAAQRPQCVSAEQMLETPPGAADDE